MTKKIIALLTDFGIDNPYVGIMKGVITTINPEARMIDLSHQIPLADIQRGAFLIWQAAQDFPPGTIFLSVVDPGVGTNRKAICLRNNDHSFIGPDNGLFSYVMLNQVVTAWELSNPEFQLKNPSNTFHGRDIFAPAAAYISLGTSGQDFGKRAHNLIKLPQPEFTQEKNKIRGEVISFDQYGNLFTSLGQFSNKAKTLKCSSWINSLNITIDDPTRLTINVNGLHLPFVTTFGSIPIGECAGLIGSTGLLEIVANQDTAKSILKLGVGSKVTLEWE